MSGSVAAQWAVPGEEDKRGAGLLFFAYGGSGEVGRFLGEVMVAARSFRAVNPALQIAVVSNNQSVDRTLFSHHVKPRNDLLFPGSPCPDTCRGDQLQRQWTTRLYYMALTPFEVTWALDAGVFQCGGASARLAVQRFLDDALATSLWGFDLGHANQAKGPHIHPHNWNLLYRWTPKTSNVFRDWFLIQLRRGITANDQGPLALAEARQMRVGGLRVGQVPTEFAAAFYSPFDAFYPRITRVLRAAAQVVHAPPDLAPRWCAALNQHAGRARQLVIREASSVARPSALLQLDNVSACAAALGVGGKTKSAGRTLPRVRRRCPYQAEWRHPRAGGSASPSGSTSSRPRMLPADLPKSYKVGY